MNEQHRYNFSVLETALNQIGKHFGDDMTIEQYNAFIALTDAYRVFATAMKPTLPPASDTVTGNSGSQLPKPVTGG